MPFMVPFSRKIFVRALVSIPLIPGISSFSKNSWSVPSQRKLLGILDSSLKFHIANAKRHGVTAGEMAEILTHAAFYAGWPKAWAALRMAKEVYEG